MKIWTRGQAIANSQLAKWAGMSLKSPAGHHYHGLFGKKEKSCMPKQSRVIQYDHQINLPGLSEMVVGAKWSDVTKFDTQRIWKVIRHDPHSYPRMIKCTFMKSTYLPASHILSFALNKCTRIAADQTWSRRSSAWAR